MRTARWCGKKANALFTLLAASGERNRPATILDGAGGAIIVFEQHAPADMFAGDVDLGAEHINGEGKRLWSTPERDRSADVAARDDLLERNFAAASDGAGGVLVVYEAEARIGKLAGRSDLLAQRLGPEGKPLWPDGKPLTVAGSGDSEKNPVVVVP